MSLYDDVVTDFGQATNGSGGSNNGSNGSSNNTSNNSSSASGDKKSNDIGNNLKNNNRPLFFFVFFLNQLYTHEETILFSNKKIIISIYIYLSHMLINCVSPLIS